MSKFSMPRYSNKDMLKFMLCYAGGIAIGGLAVAYFIGGIIRKDHDKAYHTGVAVGQCKESCAAENLHFYMVDSKDFDCYCQAEDGSDVHTSTHAEPSFKVLTAPLGGER